MSHMRSSLRWSAIALLSIVTLGACDGDNLFEGKGSVGGAQPTILSVTVPTEVRAGTPLDVRVVAQGASPISELTVRVRGGYDQTIVVSISPALLSVTRDVTINIPTNLSSNVLTVTAFATDQTGQVSDISAPKDVLVTN